MNFNKDFTEVCSWGSSQQYSSIGSDNGLAPARRQAIIWTNDDQAYWRIYGSLALNDLTTDAVSILLDKGVFSYLSSHSYASVPC